MATPSAPPQVVTVPIDFAVQSGLHKFSEEQKKRAIYVTGISKNASVKNLSDFFSFCGDVERIVQHTDPTNIDRQVAVVVFDDPGSASTAVLLAGAIVVDQPIEIFPFYLDEQDLAQRGISIEAVATATASVDGASSNAGSPAASSADDSSSSSSSSARPLQRPRKQALSVIASLAAAGYVKGEALLADMKAKAKELDASAHVSDTASQAYNATSKKIHDFDEDVHLTERVTRIKNTISTSTSEGLKTLNDKYELKSKADAVKDKAKELTNRAYEYPAIKTSVDYLTTGWSSVVGAWNSLRSETASEISKQRGIHSLSHPESESASAAAADTADADVNYAAGEGSPSVSTAATAGSAPHSLDDIASSTHNEPHQHSDPSAPAGSSSKEVLLEFGEPQANSSEPQVLYPDM